MRVTTRAFLVAVLACLFVGCGSSVKAYRLPGDNQLRPGSRIHVRLITATGADSLTVAAGGNLVSGHASSGREQAVLAAQDVQFQLGTAGFVPTESPSNADLIADFSIGAVRYDPLTGWIADQAFLQIRNAQNQEIVASYRANARWVTPTVGNLVENIMKQVRKHVSESAFDH